MFFPITKNSLRIFFAYSLLFFASLPLSVQACQFSILKPESTDIIRKIYSSNRSGMSRSCAYSGEQEVPSDLQSLHIEILETISFLPEERAYIYDYNYKTKEKFKLHKANYAIAKILGKAPDQYILLFLKSESFCPPSYIASKGKKYVVVKDLGVNLRREDEKIETPNYQLSKEGIEGIFKYVTPYNLKYIPIFQMICTTTYYYQEEKEQVELEERKR